MKHYFYLVLDNRTMIASYGHGYFKDIEGLKYELITIMGLELLKVWEIKEEVAL